MSCLYLVEFDIVTFVSKSLDSLMDKLVYRQKDVTDGCRALSSSMDRTCQDLINIGLKHAGSSKTGNGIDQMVLYTRFMYNGQPLPIWVEIQETHPLRPEEHIDYEIGRLTFGSRYRSQIEHDPTYGRLKLVPGSHLVPARINDWLGKFIHFKCTEIHVLTHRTSFRFVITTLPQPRSPCGFY